MNKVIIPFADTSCKIPLMEFTLSGKNYVALLDTGSESTLFDKNIKECDYFKKSDTEYQMSLIGLSGETSKNRIIEASATIEVTDIYDNRCKVEVYGILSDLSNISNSINERYGKHLDVSAVLGSDMLKKLGAKIDYRRQQLTIKR